MGQYADRVRRQGERYARQQDQINAYADRWSALKKRLETMSNESTYDGINPFDSVLDVVAELEAE